LIVSEHILQNVQTLSNKCRLKETKGKLILNIEEVKKVEDAIAVLSVMAEVPLEKVG